MWQSVKILNFFNTLTLKHIFWKMKTFFWCFSCFNYSEYVEPLNKDLPLLPEKIVINKEKKISAILIRLDY